MKKISSIFLSISLLLLVATKIQAQITAVLTSAAGTDAQNVSRNSSLATIVYATTGATGIESPIGLPAGVSAAWSNDKITISGIPLAMGSFNYRIPLKGGSSTVNVSGSISVVTSAGNGWVQKDSYKGLVNLKKTAFVIGNKAYFVGGKSTENYTIFNKTAIQDCWEFDPTNNTWSQKASIPAQFDRIEGYVSFSLSGKGFVCLGSRKFSTATDYSNNMFSYNPLTNTWTEKSAPFKTNSFSVGRTGAVGFSIGNKGYVGLGISHVFGYNNHRNDFYEYDPEADSWTRKADFPGTPRSGAVGFGLGNKGYVGMGKGLVTTTFASGFSVTEEEDFNDFWEYDPETNLWNKRRSLAYLNLGQYGIFSYTPIELVNAVGFSIGNKGYVGTGSMHGNLSQSFFEYNPDKNEWRQPPIFPSVRENAIGFSIGGKGYVGLGADYAGNKTDLWEFYPNFTSINITPVTTKLLCPSDQPVIVPYTVGSTQFNADNIFTAQLSDSNGTFVNPINIGSVKATGTGSISAMIPEATNGKYFRIRVVGSSPETYSNDNGTDFIFNSPVSTPSSSPSICINTALTPIIHNTFGITGIESSSGLPDGVTAFYQALDKKVVISGTPTRAGTFIYAIKLAGNCDKIFARGKIIVNPNMSVFPDSISFATSPNGYMFPRYFAFRNGATGIGVASGLPPGVITGSVPFVPNAFSLEGSPTDTGTYKFSIPLTGSGCGIGVASATGTIRVGLTTQTGTISGPLCAGKSISVPFTVTSPFNKGNMFIAQISDSLGSFSNPVNIGTPIVPTTFSGTFDAQIPINTAPGFKYRIRVVATSPKTEDVYDNGVDLIIPEYSAGPASIKPSVCPFQKIPDITHSTIGATGIGVPFGLPDGVTASWSNNKITISGTPTASGVYLYVIPLTVICGTRVATGMIIVNPTFTTDYWSKKTNLSGSARYRGVGFNIGNKGYIGTGTNGSTDFNDFWEYDPISEVWTQKANFQAGNRRGAVGFSIGNKGYVGTGFDAGFKNDFWEFDPIANLWTQKANLGADGRNNAIGFSIGNKGYVGTGSIDGGLLNDFWEYDPAKNVWTPKKNFAGTPRDGAVGFSIYKKGYVGTGNDATAYKNDFWEYDPATDAWIERASLTVNGIEKGLAYATGFSIGSKGYLGTGYNLGNKDDFFEFNPTLNTWITKLPILTGARQSSVGFSIGGKGYIGTGFNGGATNDFWQYSPTNTNIYTTEFKKDTLCPAVSFKVPYTIDCTPFQPGNVFTAQLSDSSGTFSNPLNIGSLTATDSGQISITLPSTLEYGTKYRIRVVGSLPETYGTDNGYDIVVNSNRALDELANPTICIGTAIESGAIYTTIGATGIGIASGLPPGLTVAWVKDTIVVNGTPTVTGIFNYTIPLTGGCGTISAKGIMTVLPLNTAGAASATPTVCINTAIPDITHSITGTIYFGRPVGLPDGINVTMVNNQLTISGTPTVSGVFNYSIPLLYGCGTVTATGRITVLNDNTVGDPSASPTVCINAAFTNITLSTTGATGIGTATGLPGGVAATWANNSITIGGTPNSSGIFNYSIPLTGGCGNIVAKGTITVIAANSAGAASGLTTVCINTAISGITHTTSGPTGIGVAAGMPSGVSASWANNTITISGTPTTSGTFNYSIPLTGGCGTVNATGTIVVSPNNTAGNPSATPTLCVGTTMRTAVTHTTTGATGIGQANGFPEGVSATWADNTISISGKPIASGTFNYSIPLTGGCGVGFATGTINVTPNNTAGPASALPTVCLDIAIPTAITLATTGATGIGTASFLPTGVTATWKDNQITVSGKPSTQGIFNYTIPLTGGCGIINATGKITVTKNSTLSSPIVAPKVCVGTAMSATIIHTTTGVTGIGSASGLPSGITASWSEDKIVLSGTPLVTGTFNYSILSSGGCGTNTAVGTVTVMSNNTAGPASSTPSVCIYTAIPTAITHATTGATGIGNASGLPTGVAATWDNNKIIISGTPLLSGTFNYSILLTGGCGVEFARGTITVKPDNTFANGANIAAVCSKTMMQTPITITTTGATGIGQATGLPEGVVATWTNDKITINGSPVSSGIFNFSIPLTGGCGTVAATGTLTVNPDNTAGPASYTPNVCANSTIQESITHETKGATGIGVATGLPDGVVATWFNNTIIISGTPTASGTFNYSIPLTGGCGIVAATGSITVKPSNTAGAALGSSSLCINSAMSEAITHVTTGATGIGMATGLPDGLKATFANNMVSINGTPTVLGTFNYSIPLTGGCGTVSASGSITVKPTNTAGAASATPTVCVNTKILSVITHATTVATGIGMAAGLPDGVVATWSNNTISISGTPTVSGTFNYSIPLTGGCGNVKAIGTITVTPNNTASIASATPTICINAALAAAITHVTTGATGIGIAAGLPDGVVATWSNNTISISGTAKASGTFNYTIPLTGGCGVVSATGKIIVLLNSVVFPASASPIVCINSAMQDPITHTTSGATGIGVANGLPEGVVAAWANSTLVISGTPTASGIFNYSIPLTGGCNIINATGRIVVMPNNTAGAVSGTTDICINSSISDAIMHITTGATGIGMATGLPDGLKAAFANNMVLISGTPTVLGTFNYSIPLTGGCGNVAATGSITVKPSNTAGAASATIPVCVNTRILSAITHVTTGATGIGMAAGLPNGVVANWSNNTISISGTPTASGTFNYSIPLTGGYGIVNATGTITVSVGTTSTTNISICSPQNAYTWNGQVYTSSGVYTYRTSNAAGCDSLATLNLTIMPLPSKPTVECFQTVTWNATTCQWDVTGKRATAPGISVGGATTFCAGGELLLTSSSAADNQWFKDGFAIVGATKKRYTATVAGVYSVVASSLTCASDTSAGIKVSVNPLPVVANITGNTSICIDSKSTLANASTSGIWSSATDSVATVSKTGVVTALKAGSSVIAYAVTDSIGCKKTVTTIFTVNKFPVVPKITGDTTVCMGSTTALANTTALGVWSSATPAVAKISETGIVTGASAGYSVISYTVTTNGCTTTSSSTVAVKPLPVIERITGATSICVGSTTMLSNATASGIWSSASPALASVNAAGMVNGISAGSAVVAYTVTVNGCSNTITQNLTTIGLPTSIVGTPPAYCENAPTNILTATATAGHTLTWYGTVAIGGTGSSTAPTPSSVNAGIFNYYVSQTNTSTGCESPRSKIAVTIYPTPGKAIITRDATGTLSSSEATGNQWFWNGNLIAGETRQTYKPVQSGPHTITLTQNGCLGPMSENYYNLITAIPTLSSNEFVRLYPNPVKSMLTINFGLNGYKYVDLKLFDMTGKLITDKKKLSNGSKINLSGLVAGMYRYQIVGNDGRILYSDKFMKE